MTRFLSPPESAARPPHRRNDDPECVDFRLLRQDDPARRLSFLEGQQIVEIEVKDNGSGIAPEHIQRVFDPFFTTKEVGKGTGLGLSVSQRIVESFHGDICVESRFQEGTSVRLRLPIAEIEEREATGKDEKKCINC
jgi:signal transduction histidine kinase